MTFDLPMPPSVNHYWRHSRHGTYLSDAGRKYRAEVLKRIKSPVVLYPHQRLAVTIVLHPKDKRRFDIDNRIKALFDAMEKAQIYADDSQIDRMLVIRDRVVGKSGCKVRIKVLR